MCGLESFCGHENVSQQLDQDRPVRTPTYVHVDPDIAVDIVSQKLLIYPA